jgi:hypothetical protein
MSFTRCAASCTAALLLLAAPLAAKDGKVVGGSSRSVGSE